MNYFIDIELDDFGAFEGEATIDYGFVDGHLDYVITEIDGVETDSDLFRAIVAKLKPTYLEEACWKDYKG